MRRFCMLGLAVAALSLPAVVAAKPADPIKVASASSLKGAQRVVIGQFTIGFLMERKDSAKAGGGLMGNGFGGRSTTRSTLSGVSPEELQAIADSAYADLVDRLKSSGFEVLDRSGLAAHPAYAKTKTTPAPHEATTITGRDDKAKVLFVSATQTAPLRLLAGDLAAGGLSAMGMIMNGSQVSMAAAEFAKTNDVRVVNAIYYVDFADSDEYGGWFRSSSAVKIKGSLALLPDQSKISIIGPDYKTATLSLANPVAVGGDFFEAADTTSGSQKASQAVANVIGILGGVGTNSSKRMTFTARPGTYVPGATQATVDANTMLVERFVTLR